MFYKKKLGIIGGGQLCRMLVQAAADYNLFSSVLDNDSFSPSRYICNDFIEGDINCYDAVLDFGKNLDIITVEIDQVNVDALKDLEQSGKSVFPQPDILRIIQDKGLQKQFFTEHQIPTAKYSLVNSVDEIKLKHTLPFIQKIRKFGYDGKGVVSVSDDTHLKKLIDAPSIIEEMIKIKKEISLMVARNSAGEIRYYPISELVFNKDVNLIDYIFSPSNISTVLEKEAINIATTIINSLKLVGVLAIEMFITEEGELLVNEISPRPHNTGHHTIEASVTSQFEQHLRAILNLPLGSTESISPSVMINLLGEKNSNGAPKFINLEEVLKLKKAYLHLYGKSECKPYRKMGHVTILDDDLDSAFKKAKFIREKVVVTS